MTSKLLLLEIVGRHVTDASGKAAFATRMFVRLYVTLHYIIIFKAVKVNN